MPKGLSRINNYYNRVAAINDFYKLAVFAVSVGCPDLAEKHLPPADAGHRTIDKHLAKLRGELEAKGFTTPPNPSAAQERGAN